ncbi:MAG: 4-(cytidine 5'-diphospho)-2-C-methyl-D-erythritol kinase [Candidatus Omnitrophota bacterium]
MRQLEITAPAKINLFLEVLPKPDGAVLHPVDTVIEKIDLCDRLALKVTSGRLDIKSNIPSLAAPSNLAFKAARLLKRTYRIKEGVSISLSKKIPMSAGLGGGSSDAAAVLLGLNQLWKIQEPVSRLVPLALELGSDVPVFLFPGRCLVSGFGEKVKTLSTRKKFQYLLILTGVKISTAAAYQWLDENLTYKPYSSKIMVDALKKGTPELVAQSMFNRFEEEVTKREKRLRGWKKNLDENFNHYLLTGSGGAFFAFLSEENAGNAVKFLRVSTYGR